MEGLHILKYAVRGIKNIDQWAELSFYKKTIDRRFDIHGYNVKGIYGANGAGKSGLISSAKILSSILCKYLYFVFNVNSNGISHRSPTYLYLGLLNIINLLIFNSI